MAGGLRQLACRRYAHAENCRQSQALRTRGHEICGTSRAACMPMMKIAESLKLFGSFGHAAPENGGTSHAVCLEKMKLPTGSGSLQFLRAPLPKMAGRLRQLACPRYAHAENCRQSQAPSSFCFCFFVFVLYFCIFVVLFCIFLYFLYLFVLFVFCCIFV